MAGLTEKHRKAINYYLLGATKKDACRRAGFSPLSASDVFGMREVQEEIEKRVQMTERKTDLDREWVLDKLRQIVDLGPGELIEVDENGRPSLNFNLLTPKTKKLLTKVTINGERKGGKYKNQKTSVSMTWPDKLAALKEIAILLGIREEKTRVSAEQELIDALMRRRQELTGAGNS